MAILKDNNFKISFWGAKNRFITGLDPLGMQTASQAAFAHVMPGITNVTHRVRYLGFYCWLLHTYAKEIRHHDAARQRNFIRRAELLLAIAIKSHIPEQGQVSGSLFASNLIAEENELYDIARYADYENRSRHKIYWKYSWGAFGQYYVGSMVDLGLVTLNNHENYICTNAEAGWKNNGKDLAIAFEQRVPEEVRNNFIACVEEGTLPEKNTEPLSRYFSLENIEPHSTEWSIYIRLLTGEDHPTNEAIDENHSPSFYRKTTLTYLLQYLQTAPEKDWPGLLDKIYDGQGERTGGKNKTKLLWYYYQLNELWHFGAGTIFWSLMNELKEKQQVVPLSGFVHFYCQEIVAQLCENFDVSASSEVEDLLLSLNGTENEVLDKIGEAMGNNKSLEAGAAGFTLLFLIYSKNEPKVHNLKEIAWSEGIWRDGSFIDGFDFLRQGQSKTIQEFIQEFVYQWIIYRHQFVAIRKTGSSTTSTLKFIVEESQIQYLENFPPHFTSPRLGSLMNYLRDLSLLKADFNLSSIGQSVLEEVKE